MFLVCAQWMLAQSVSVASFRALENDLTANTYGTMEKDQNGEIAALIKIVTNETGFLFDGGMTGIVRVKQDVGEVWVYVPHGIKRITIKHPQLGVLRDYYFPIPIAKARTYEMVLSTGKVQTIVQHSVNKQYVIFNVEPANAVVELGDEILSVSEDGYAQKSVGYGKYNYRVSCANYHTQAGVVQVTSKGKAVVNVTLKPNFGWMQLTAPEDQQGAYVYLNNERVGQIPFMSQPLKSGDYQLRVIKPMYKPYVRQLTVSDNDTIKQEVTLDPNFAVVTLNTSENAEIWVDGQMKARGTWTGPLETGDYTVEVKQESHRPRSQILSINDYEARTVQLPAPDPICGSLDISSSPSLVKVLIDGEELGETPLIQNDVLVGTRELIFRKRGYNDVLRTIEVKENETTTLNVRMSKGSLKLESEVVRKREEVRLAEEARLAAEADSAAQAESQAAQETVQEPVQEQAPVETPSQDVAAPQMETPVAQPQTTPVVEQPKLKPSPVSSYRKAAFYLEGNGTYWRNTVSTYATIDYGFGAGVYLGGLNLHVATQFGGLPQLQLKTGLSMPLGSYLLVTPQVGLLNLFDVQTSEWVSYTDSHGDFYLIEHEESKDVRALSLACRVQLCLTKNIALAVTPEYHIYDKASLENLDTDYIPGFGVPGLGVRASLVLNFGVDARKY
ncbi:MAG: PEGA domain-containing protein [Bacteroidales bacterium]|nr:PEGA domain-containing protein [Bacteroidales bacterium]MBQ5605046.1 PEGA domain-containing protein [Bacteroidales bacterium]